MKRKQPEVLADPAMIPFLRFFEPLQVRLQLGLVREGRAVDALHRLALRVSLPVGVRRVQQLERFEPPGRRHVRTDAEIDERVAILDRVAGDLGLAFGLLLDQLHLERLALLREEPLRLFARPHLALVRQIGRCQLLHLPLDRLEIFRHERAIDDEVVEEALRRSPDRCRTARRETDWSPPPPSDARCCVDRAAAPPGSRGVTMRTAASSRSGNVKSTSLPLTMAATRRFRQPRRDLCRNVGRRRSGGHETARPVGQRDGNLGHGNYHCGEAACRPPSLAFTVAALRLQRTRASYGAQPSQWLANHCARATTPRGCHERQHADPASEGW